jgi:hypothetical protein
VTGFRDNDVGSTARWAAAAAVVLGIAQWLGLPVNVRPFFYVIAGFAALFAVSYLIDRGWAVIRQRRAGQDEPKA